MLGWLTKLFAGEASEETDARARMAVDARDPRKLFVWGVLCVAEGHDPGWKPAYAKKAITEWYGLKTREALLAQTADTFNASGRPAYDHFRLCFLARAGFGAGFLSDAESWDAAFRSARAIQAAYPGWQAFGADYRDGHLAYRATQGDPPEQLAKARTNLDKIVAEKQRTVWVAVPWATPLG